MYDVGCYPLNLISLVTGCEPISIAVECDKPHGVDINLSATLRYNSGLIASLHCGFNAFGQVHSTITGTKGLLEVPDTFLNDPGQISLHTSKGLEQIDVSESDRYAEEILDFSTAILSKRAPMLSLDESLMNMRILEKILTLTREKGVPDIF